MSYMVLFGLYFIVCQIVVTKKWFPAFLRRQNASGTTLQQMGLIALSIVVSTLAHLGWVLPVMVTVFGASVIAGKYRDVFEQMEKGQKV